MKHLVEMIHRLQGLERGHICRTWLLWYFSEQDIIKAAVRWWKWWFCFNYENGYGNASVTIAIVWAMFKTRCLKKYRQTFLKED